MPRIAVIDYDRCSPKKCGGWLCIRSCPVNRTGKECIVRREEDKKPLISETLCTGCGICVHKCPFSAIRIINLPSELDTPVHRFGENGFRLYGLPYPKEGPVIGLVGANGTGKSTALKILSNELTPNLGNLGKKASLDEVVHFFKGKELMNFFEKLKEKKISVAVKPQNVNLIPETFRGKVKSLLEKVDETGKLEKIVSELELRNVLDNDISNVSGGELQRIAIAATLLKKAELYFFDEPSSYLDIRQRLKIASLLSSLAQEKVSVLVVEHDLAVLDYLSDYVHVLYGTPAAYGVVSGVKSVRNGLNEFLAGFLKEENIRFREKEISFEAKPPSSPQKRKPLISYPALEKKFENFSLSVESAELFKAETLGILGPNATGKTTFVKMLASEFAPDNTELSLGLKVSCKSQYLKAAEGVSVQELFAQEKLNREIMESEIERRLKLRPLMDQQLSSLSGGQLQKVAIALALSREADLFLLDEPSAFLDVEERLRAADAIRAVVEKTDKTALVVDHDILFIDYISDRLMVFEGEPGRKGIGRKPKDMREGMNSFLRQMNVSFRRDPESRRPRANKPSSLKDREQKEKGEFFYTG